MFPEFPEKVLEVAMIKTGLRGVFEMIVVFKMLLARREATSLCAIRSSLKVAMKSIVGWIPSPTSIQHRISEV